MTPPAAAERHYHVTQEMMMLKVGLTALAACALATSAAAASTNDPFVKDSATLRLEGIDLSTADGQERLAIRMNSAARDVCGDNLATVHLAAAASARECRTAVFANIRSQIEARMAENTPQTQLASAR